MRKSLVAVLVAVAMAFAACGSDSSDSGSDADAAVAAADPNGVIRFAFSITPVPLDPHRIPSPASIVYLMAVYDRLVYEAPNGEIQPMLASSWKISDTKLQLKLREGVKFQDGTAFNAAAVKSNIERGKTLAGSTAVEKLADITAVRVVDDLTVELDLKGPPLAVLSTLTREGGMMISPAAMAKTDLATAPVGAGPFTVKEYRTGDRVIYAKWSDYWNADAIKLGGYEVVFGSNDDARLNGFLASQIDYTFLRPAQYEQMKNGQYEIITTPQFSTQGLLLNTSRKPLDDVRVRQAINHALDRKTLIDTVYSGQCDTGIQLYPPNHATYNKNYGVDYWKYDTAKAKKLLADAGHANGITLTVATINTTDFQTQTQAVQGQLAAVGITLKLEVSDVATAQKKYNIDKTVDAIYTGVNHPSEPTSTFTQFYTKTGSQNPGGLEDPAIADLLEQAGTEQNLDKRNKLLQDVSGKGTELAMYAKVCTNRSSFIIQDSVEGFVGWQSGSGFDIPHVAWKKK